MASKKKATAKKPAARKTAKKAKATQVCVEVVRGACGLSVYLNGYHIAGEKPWGGGDVLRRWLTDEKDVATAMKQNRVDPKDVQLI